MAHHKLQRPEIPFRRSDLLLAVLLSRQLLARLWPA